MLGCFTSRPDANLVVTDAMMAPPPPEPRPRIAFALVGRNSDKTLTMLFAAPTLNELLDNAKVVHDRYVFRHKHRFASVLVMRFDEYRGSWMRYFQWTPQRGTRVSSAWSESAS